MKNDESRLREKIPQKCGEKDFDCVKMMRDIRDQINTEIIDMDSEQLIEYFRSKSKEYEKKYGRSVSSSPTN